MSNIELLTRTRISMVALHKDQVDKAGVPYVNHLHNVANRVAHLGPEYEILAWAHDSVEDHSSKVDYDYFRKLGWPEHLIFALDCITKRKEEKKAYYPYLDRVRLSEYAYEVKKADLDHNSDMSRLKIIKVADIERKKKYDDAIAYLNEKGVHKS